MPNLEYCKFQNTLDDLIGCRESLLYGDSLEDMSAEEREAAKNLIKVCGQIFNETKGWGCE